jgi:hypothetical protein
MPSSAVLAFSDLDDLSAAPVRGGRFEITLAGRGEFAAKIVRVELQQLFTSGFLG